jgi:hypothetical protein
VRERGSFLWLGGTGWNGWKMRDLPDNPTGNPHCQQQGNGDKSARRPRHEWLAPEKL